VKVVLDTNVLVSALLKRDSVPGRILQGVWNGSLELLLSAPLHQELVSVLQYPKIRRRLAAQAADVGLFMELLPFFTTSVTLVEVSAPRPRDEDDWMVLATLVAGHGDWLISGDRDLLALADRFPILAPAAFVGRFLA
jgi:uncharacterized protein